MPNPEQIKRALDLIRIRPANHEYFFRKLSSPDWLAPLDEEGLFASPPPAIREGDLIRFPNWPESQYLARMAPLAPDQVSAIMNKIPETDNVRVHHDLATAALALPGPLAAIWVRSEIVWINQQDHLYFLLPEILGELIEYLTNNDCPAEALELARALLDIRAANAPIRNVHARFDSWSYEQIIKTRIPALIARTGTLGFALICDLLEKAIHMDSADNDEDGDFSYIWRPAIEAHSQNHSFGEIPDTLVDSIRDNALALVDRDANPGEIVRLLAERTCPIFNRLALYVMGERSSLLPEAAESAATALSNFRSVKVFHEYIHLLGKVFPSLGSDSRDLILGWIDDGPPEDYLNRFEPDNRERIKAHWQVRWLSGLKEVLPPEWQEKLAELADEVGEPEHPDFHSYSSSWVGPTSPLSASDLNEMSPPDIAAYLNSWRPTDEWDAPTPEGLGRTLQPIVCGRAEEFVSHLDSFKESDPTYVRFIVQGLADAIKGGATVDWAPVLSFLQWLTRQQRSTAETHSAYNDRDPHWGWSWRSAASLISYGLAKKLIEFPWRNQVWEIIQNILRDPDPTPEDDARFSMDPATQSINTTRGEAMHAVVRYALWVRSSLLETTADDDQTPVDLDSIPEAKRQFEAHLDLGQETSPAIRSVYGQWLNQLFILDRTWVQEQLPTLFPNDHPEARSAVWDTYLTHCPVYDEVFRLIRSEYERATDQLPREERNGQSMGRDPSVCLGEHLLILVGRGVLKWRESDIVAKFFEKAPVDTTARCVAFVGRSLQTPESIPGEVGPRLVEFWASLRSAAAAGPTDRLGMLKPFGWWFGSGFFADDWAFEQLLEVYRICGSVEPDFQVLERLARVAADRPAQCLSAFAFMIRSEADRWTYWGHLDESRKILEAGLTNATTRPQAEALIHEIGARGDMRFRELLSNGDEAPPPPVGD